MPPAYVTTTGRAALALLVAAILGPLLLTISEIVFSAARGGAVSLAEGWNSIAAPFAAVIAPFFAIFLLFVGFPAWLALDLTGRRSWRWLAATGALLGFAVSLWLTVTIRFVPSPRHSEGFRGGLVFDYKDAIVATPAGITAHGWWTAFVESLPPALACALLGLVIWRIAYRRIVTS